MTTIQCPDSHIKLRTAVLSLLLPHTFGLSFVHGQHLPGLAHLDTILRMTAEWEGVQMMTEEASKNSHSPPQLSLEIATNGCESEAFLIYIYI